MGSSLITLLTLLVGLGSAVVLVASLLARGTPSSQGWILASAAVAVVALAAGLPTKARDSGKGLNGQRKAFAGTNEPAARQKCLRDVGRPELVAALAFARGRMPENARFTVTTRSPSVACLMINLFPRRPLRAIDADPVRAWTVFDGTAPAEVVRAAQRDRRLPMAKRRYLAQSPSFILVRPTAEVQR